MPDNEKEINRLLTLNRIQRKKKTPFLHVVHPSIVYNLSSRLRQSSSLTLTFFSVPHGPDPSLSPSLHDPRGSNSLLTHEPNTSLFGTLAYLECSSAHNFTVGTSGAQLRETMGPPGIGHASSQVPTCLTSTKTVWLGNVC